MRKVLLFLLILAALLLGAIAVAAGVGFRYAYEPSAHAVVSRSRPAPEAYDLWGRVITAAQAASLSKSPEGRAQLSPAGGAVKVDAELLSLGRSAFYKETFNNEIFITDIVGILNGPLRISNVTQAILARKGAGTTNLRVKVPETVTIGDRTFEKGSYFDTGLDVPRGALLPLGIAVSVSAYKIRIGITCALCHATVDPATHKVVEGAPNQDLNAGLLLALATNSTTYFMHTDVDPRTVQHDERRTVVLSNGQRQALPDVVAMENAVDTALLKWPRGNFDSLTDMRADPTQLPVSFTWRNHPYGWSGNFMAGPFRGLSAQNNNVHALNADSLLLADSSPVLFDMDKEMFLGMLLQNAPSGQYRFDPASGKRPSAFLDTVKPPGSQPGVNQAVPSPTYPKATLLSPNAMFTTAPGHPVWQQNNAMAAWQDTLVPPPANLSADDETKQRGRQVFEQAGCVRCHAGPFLTNNSVVPSSELGVNATRGQALQKTERNFAPPLIYAFDTPVPLPSAPKVLSVPVDGLDQKQVDLAWGHHGSEGGYKVPALVGLFWSAPYLHDGGVAVGAHAESELGLPGTVQKNIPVDAGQSLRALVDRTLRARVVAANAASPDLQRMNVQGVGHDFWVDREAGFSDADQQALITYLLTFDPPS